jgi:hypothetical protein
MSKLIKILKQFKNFEECFNEDDHYFDFSYVGLGDAEYSFELFVSDFLKFANEHKDRTAQCSFINMKRNFMTKKHMKKFIKRVKLCGCLPSLKGFDFSGNKATEHEIYCIIDDLHDIVGYRIYTKINDIRCILQPGILKICPYKYLDLPPNIWKFLDSLDVLSDSKKATTLWIIDKIWMECIRNFHTYGFSSIKFSLSSDEDLCSNLESIMRGSKFRGLKLSYCEFEEFEDFNEFCNVIFYCPHLCHLEILDCEIDLDELVSCISYSTSLISCRIFYDDDQPPYNYDHLMEKIEVVVNRNIWRRNTLLTGCSLIIGRHREIGLSKDVAKIISKMIFDERFDLYELYEE